MEFRQCTIGGKVYKGEFDASSDEKKLTKADGSRSLDSSDDSSRRISDPNTFVPPTTDDAPLVKLSEGVLTHFRDDALTSDIRNISSAQNGETLNHFWSTLALCHTVLASISSEDGSLSYKAQSPDEAALVQAAADVGYIFLGKEPSSQVLRMRTPTGQIERYELLNVLDFTSARKRMSVILRRLLDGGEEGELVLLCKGADNVIFERLEKGRGDVYRDQTGTDLDFFASEGLRTLCLARKVISGGFTLFS